MNMRHTLTLCFLSLMFGISTSNGNGICDDLTADVIFVLDATTNSFFYEMNRFLQHFTYDASNKARFAAISFSTDSEMCYNFSKPYSNDTGPRSRRDYMLASCMGNLPVITSQRNATKANTETQRNTAKAIKLARNQIQSSGRPEVEKFVILATDGLPQDYNQTLKEARLLHLMKGVVMIVITTKQLSSATELISLTSSPLHFISIDESDFTFHLDHQLLDLLCIRHLQRRKRRFGISCPDRSYTADPGRTCVHQTWTLLYYGDQVYFNGRPPNDCYPAGDTTINIMKYRSSSVQCTFHVRVAVHYCSSLPGIDPNGYRSCSGDADNVYGSTCFHYCNNGYSLTGDYAVTCNLRSDSAQWSSHFPSCQVQHCEALPFFLYGSRQCSRSDTNVFQSVCTHTCNSGFTLHGSYSIECVAQSSTVRWSSTFPVCYVQHCEALPSFLNGSRHCTGTNATEFQSVCTHACKTGFTLEGSTRIECLAQSTSVHWNSAFPVCRKNEEEMAEEDNQTGTIVGAVLGTLFALAGIILIIVWIRYRGLKSRRHNGASRQAKFGGIRDNRKQVFALDNHAMGLNHIVYEKNDCNEIQYATCVSRGYR